MTKHNITMAYFHNKTNFPKINRKSQIQSKVKFEFKGCKIRPKSLTRGILQLAEFSTRGNS